MAFRRIGRFRESDLLAQRRGDLVDTRRVDFFTLGSEASDRRLDIRRVELVELLDVINDPGDLWSKQLELRFVQLEMSELGHFRDVLFFYRHNFSGSIMNSNAPTTRWPRSLLIL